MSVSTVTMFESEGLAVWAEVNRLGDLIIQGQDLGDHVFGGEYEYALTVPASQVAAVAQALGGEEAAEVLGLLKANGQRIVQMGERKWLQSLGVEVQTWTHINPPDMD